MATAEEINAIVDAVWGAQIDTQAGQYLHSIPMTEFIHINELTSTTTSTTTSGSSGSSDTTWVGDPNTYTIPNGTITYPNPFSPPWPFTTPYQPWETQPFVYTPPNPFAEIVESVIYDEDLEVVEGAEIAVRHLTGEKFTRLKLKLPEMTQEQLTEVIKRLDAEMKLAIIRALQLVPKPQRLRTLILEEPDDVSASEK